MTGCNECFRHEREKAYFDKGVRTKQRDLLKFDGIYFVSLFRTEREAKAKEMTLDVI